MTWTWPRASSTGCSSSERGERAECPARRRPPSTGRLELYGEQRDGVSMGAGDLRRVFRETEGALGPPLGPVLAFQALAGAVVDGEQPAPPWWMGLASRRPMAGVLR